MNTWEAYKEVEDQLRGVNSHTRDVLDSMIDPVHRMQPITSVWLEEHLVRLRLQVAFLAAAHARLALVETAEATRSLTQLTPLELPLTPAYDR